MAHIAWRGGAARCGPWPAEPGCFARLEVAQGSVNLNGSGSGLIAFAFREIDGRRQMGPAWTADCRTYDLAAGSPISSAIVKAGGYSDDQPDAAFCMAFFADPLVRLPAGRWEITATAQFAVGD
jgi:hypothetical protein